MKPRDKDKKRISRSINARAHSIKKDENSSSVMLDPHQIRQFYLRGFKETAKLYEWPGIWRKQFKIRTREGHFMKLNKLRKRLNFRSLLGFCVRYTPLNLYMSALNWLMPERVGGKSRRARGLVQLVREQLDGGER